MPRICRFCLDVKNGDENPLLRPCKCKGSAAYVHADCIRIWRRTTTVSFNVTNCQVCLQKYDLPAMFPLEEIPDDDAESLVILSNPFMVWVSSLVFSNMVYIGIAVMREHISGKSHLTISDVLEQKISGASNFITINIFTLMYAHFYAPYIMKVFNKPLYLQYWHRLDFNLFECPFYFLFFSVCVYVASLRSIVSVVSLTYIYCLPQFYKKHVFILRQMNRLP